MPNTTTDVVVIGAGVAGLACAEALHRAAYDVVVLEARERIGGRILTRRELSLAAPIELGAEFVHGSAPAVAQLATRFSLAVAEVGGDRWRADGGVLRRDDDFWQRLERVMGRLRPRAHDRAFAEFLTERPGGAARSRERALAKRWVEGFHGADPERLSERSMLEDGSPGDDEVEKRAGRLVAGYDALPIALARPLGDRIRLGSVVRAVVRDADVVAVRYGALGAADEQTLNARAVVCAVPLGVLQAPAGEPGAIAFDPPLGASRPHREALAGMEMGAVVRLVLQLESRFWTDPRYAAGRGQLDLVSFVQTDDPDFPSWWTGHPLRVPMLVAWSGGPPARRLASLTDDERASRAIASMARQFKLGSRRAARLVTGVWQHDWLHDPFARGAYSFMRVGGSDAPRRLSRPVGDALFFAGEAADPEGRNGTVHGAIESGWHAARQVRRALG